MANNNAKANEILKAWHENMQKIISDPKTSEMMIENYLNLTKMMYSNLANYNDEKNKQSVDISSKQSAIEAKLDELESRIKILEKIAAKS